MGTALITRTPVLVSERHTLAYTYIEGPAAVHRGVGEPEIEAIGRLRAESLFAGRSTRPAPHVQEAGWRALLDDIQAENVAMWKRHLVRAEEDEALEHAEHEHK